MTWHRAGRRRFIAFLAFCAVLVVIGQAVESRTGRIAVLIAVVAVVVTVLVYAATRGVGRGRSTAFEVENPYASSGTDHPGD